MERTRSGKGSRKERIKVNMTKNSKDKVMSKSRAKTKVNFRVNKANKAITKMHKVKTQTATHPLSSNNNPNNKPISAY